MKKEGYKTLWLLTLLILVLAACNQAAAKCPCSSGGSASYNFLGDPAVDVNMNSYPDSVQANAQHCSVEVLLPTPENAAQSMLNLDLGRRGKIEVLLSPKDGKHVGQGNLTSLGNLTGENKAEQLQATALLEGNKLSLDVRTQSGDLYSFELAKEGKAVMGDYVLSQPDGKTQKGIADGKWERLGS
jgi:hypothetical protein